MTTRQIFWASGACLALKKEAFVKAKGFDEDLFAHQEEIDLCWRMQQQGGIIHYIEGLNGVSSWRGNTCCRES